jgi:hypothetical protein
MSSQPDRPSDPHDPFAALESAAEGHGTAAMFAALVASLRDRRRWHALFDARLLEARMALGLPATGDLAEVPADARDRLDDMSLAACREVGWPLLEEGQVAAGWMYLRAAAEPAEVAAQLAAQAEAIMAASDPATDEAAANRLQEIVHVALWEGVDPSLGIDLVIRTQGTCSAITAYEQAVSRLPARRQERAAGVLAHHLRREIVHTLGHDLAGRGIRPADANDPPASLLPLIEALGHAPGGDNGAIHVDVSHLQSVLRIARVCTDPAAVTVAWELACYACRLPPDVVYPGEPPFEEMGESSRLFYAALLGRDVDRAIGHFRREAARARLEDAGTLPADTLVLLLSRLGRPREALAAALERPADARMPSAMQAAGMLPSLVDLAAAGDAWDDLLAACRARGDEITFAAAVAARDRGRRNHQSR